MTMRSFEYIKKEVVDSLWMNDLQKVNDEAVEIEKAIRYFVSFALEVDGGVNKTWLKRNKSRMKSITQQYRVLLDIVGKENLEKVVATNIFRLVLSPKSKELISIRKNLLEKFNIQNYSDLDLRYSINCRDNFIFWDSIMYLVNNMDVS